MSGSQAAGPAVEGMAVVLSGAQGGSGFTGRPVAVVPIASRTCGRLGLGPAPWLVFGWGVAGLFCLHAEWGGETRISAGCIYDLIQTVCTLA